MKAKTLFLLISILLTTLLWIGLDLDHAYNRTYLPTVPQPISENISPDLDHAAIRLLRGR